MTYLLLLAVLLVLLFVWNHYRLLSVLQRNKIPTATPRFFDGNLFQLVNKNVLTQGKWLKELGPIVGYYMGSTPCIVTTDTELIKKIQVKDFHLFTQKRSFGVIGGLEASKELEQSLVHADVPGKRWKEQRSLITSAFSSAKMKTAVPLVDDALDAFLENIEEKSREDKDFDIYDFFQRLTMDTIGRSAFGIQTNVQRNPKDPFYLATRSIFENKAGQLPHLLFFASFMFPELNYILYPIRKLQWGIMRALGWANLSYQKQVIKKIIAERRNNMFDPQNPWSRNDLLQQMIDAKMSHEQMKVMDTKKLTAEATDTSTIQSNADGQTTEKQTTRKVHYMTDAEVAANAALFFDAGYETTSTLLGFLAHVIVNDQSLQDRLREEINELFEREGKFDYNTMTSLPLLDSVINETLRFYPPITDFVSREAAVDYEYNGMVIPKGTGITIAVYQLHHDPNHWEDPDTFIPDRFLKDKSLSSSVAFQPFGAGPRNCVGLRFALMEAKMAIARLLKSYKLVLGPRTEIGDIECQFKPISMTPKKGVFVKVVKL